MTGFVNENHGFYEGQRMNLALSQLTIKGFDQFKSTVCTDSIVKLVVLHIILLKV